MKQKDLLKENHIIRSFTKYLYENCSKQEYCKIIKKFPNLKKNK